MAMGTVLYNRDIVSLTASYDQGSSFAKVSKVFLQGSNLHVDRLWKTCKEANLFCSFFERCVSQVEREITYPPSPLITLERARLNRLVQIIGAIAKKSSSGTALWNQFSASRKRGFDVFELRYIAEGIGIEEDGNFLRFLNEYLIPQSPEAAAYEAEIEREGSASSIEERLSLFRTFMRERPDAIGKLTTFYPTWSFDGAYSALPEEVGLLFNLEKISISSATSARYITALPPSFCNLKQLTQIDASCYHSPSYIKQFPEELFSLPNLREINFKGVNLEQLPDLDRFRTKPKPCELYRSFTFTVDGKNIYVRSRSVKDCGVLNKLLLDLAVWRNKDPDASCLLRVLKAIVCFFALACAFVLCVMDLVFRSAVFFFCFLSYPFAWVRGGEARETLQKFINFTGKVCATDLGFLGIIGKLWGKNFFQKEWDIAEVEEEVEMCLGYKISVWDDEITDQENPLYTNLS